MAPAGAPSILYVVLDDVGFSAMEPWGGLIDTPNINKLAANGLTYTNWHTTALCSPTRSSLLTGRNHTTNGMACIAEATTGYPNANGHIPFECATIAEVLGERGWNTYMQSIFGALLTAGYATAAAAALAGAPPSVDFSTSVQNQLTMSFAGAADIAQQYPQYSTQILQAAKESFLAGDQWAYLAGIVAVLMDVRLPDGSGIEACREIRA